MAEVISPDYQGPERRKSIIIEQCACHLKHEAVLKEHTSDIKTLESDMKSRITWKIFTLAVLIVVGSIGGLWVQVRANHKDTDGRLDIMNQRLERVDTREQIFENNVSITLQSINNSIRELHEDLEEHRKEYRTNNGDTKSKGDTQ